MTPCQVCPTLESLLDSAERVIIQGWRDSSGRRWIVDVLTTDREGHGNAVALMNAIEKAVQEVTTGGA